MQWQQTGRYLTAVQHIDPAGKRRMGRKDMAGRDFFSDMERFAELLNIHLYHGEQVVLADNLMKKLERISIIKRMHKKGMEEALIREMTGCTKKECM